MASYKVLIKSSAGKEIAAVGPKQNRQRIVAKILGLGANPRPHGSEKLAGYSDRYWVRLCDYRIVYLIDDGANEVTIFKVGNRRDVYR